MLVHWFSSCPATLRQFALQHESRPSRRPSNPISASTYLKPDTLSPPAPHLQPTDYFSTPAINSTPSLFPLDFDHFIVV
ncbi:hypothetical protein E2C01_016797 [Portunus trituberculatus]|uniref:Uncharacterized protein n=1 Tax=Portunus trituberculatus TaxID=210409 RepID=A0A5B7DS41_PORTR|nr:hypothetical protein [Portunus trituberculatus]